jgi:hypothetical protein
MASQRTQRTQRPTFDDLDQQLEREAKLRRAKAIRAELEGPLQTRIAALLAIIRVLTEEIGEHTGDPLVVISYEQLRAARQATEVVITVGDDATTTVDIPTEPDEPWPTAADGDGAR